MVAYSGNDPVNVSSIAQTYTSKGLISKYAAGGLTLTAAVTDVAICYSIAESSRDADSALEAAGTGTVSVVALDGICYLKTAVAIAAPVFGISIYVAANGLVSTAAGGGAVLLGYYFGSTAAVAVGDFIPVSC